MRTVQLRLHAPNKAAADVYEILGDFGSYPTFCDAVQHVVVTEVSDDVTISQWEVTFRAGLLRWTEEDQFDRDALTITFRQLEGDVALFDGTWQCADVPTGCEITFCARLDMGIPSLADALEPIAVRTLIDNTVSIVIGLVATAEVVSSDVTVPQPVGGRP
jgi:ribosome-associated toxin RatA of RatAB toxin-antitoxin module